jgi:hypothetical protein
MSDSAPRAQPLEPVHHGDGQREVTRAGGAQRNEDDGAVKAAHAVDLAERQKAQAHQHHANVDQGARAKPVHQPAHGRAQQGAFNRLQGGRARQGGLAPAALFRQHGHIRAKGLHEQAGVKKLEAKAGADDAPAIENFHPPSIARGRGAPCIRSL